MTKCCKRCNRIDVLLAAPVLTPFATWPAVTVTVDGSVIRRRDALSGEWQYGWRVRDGSDEQPGDAAPGGAAGRPTGPA